MASYEFLGYRRENGRVGIRNHVLILIGIEPGWTSRVVEGIAKTGKPVAGFAIEQSGDHNTIAAASRKAKEVRTCNGRATAAEALGHRELVLTKLHRSA